MRVISKVIMARQRRIQLFMPRNQSGVVQRINNRALQVYQHLQVVVVLDVVALQESDFPVDDHELCVKGTHQRLVEVHHLHIDIGNFTRMRQVDFFAGGLLLGDDIVWPVRLPCVSAVVQDLEHYPRAFRSGPTVQFPDGIGDVLGCHAVLPVVGGQENLLLGANDDVGHVAHNVGHS
jgi:hypothetical protein